MEIHRELGKGHDEVIYKDALVVELIVLEFRFRARKITKSRTKELSCLTITTRFCCLAEDSLKPKLSKN